LCCLSHADLQAEYERYTILYLADKTTKHVRGMAEMTVIKLGEMVLPVVKPQAKRIAMVAQQLEEARLANEASLRELAAGAQAREQRTKLEAMNKTAFDACVPMWRELIARERIARGGGRRGDAAAAADANPNGEGGDGGGEGGGGSGLGDVAQLTKRLLRRPELRVALESPDKVR
jgi:hypothetical protein